jgi:hypothetical protein
MSTPVIRLGEEVWTLPPLILHPFNERVPPSALLENSKAALMLSGLIPSDGSEESELKRRLLVGRCSEARMLFFLGKDVFRWLEQCTEWAARVPELTARQLAPQSFAELLTAPPEAVREKLTRWGVADYGSIFSRAIALHATLTEPPALEALTDDFLRNYYRYADALYRAWLELQPHTAVSAAHFRFELYASGEYSQMLESQWAE